MWKEDEVIKTVLTKGTYKNVYWQIESVRVNTSEQTLRWTAGFRGTGFARTNKECKENIIRTIDNSIEKRFE